MEKEFKSLRMDLEMRRCDGCGELQDKEDGLACNEDGDAWCQKCFKKVGIVM